MLINTETKTEDESRLCFQPVVRAASGDSPVQEWPETSCAVHTNLISSKCHGGSRCGHWLWYQALQASADSWLRQNGCGKKVFFNLGSVCVWGTLCDRGCRPWGRVDAGPWNRIPCMSDTVKASASPFNISQWHTHRHTPLSHYPSSLFFIFFFTSLHPPVHALLYLIASTLVTIFSTSSTPRTSLLFYHFFSLLVISISFLLAYLCLHARP